MMLYNRGAMFIQKGILQYNQQNESLFLRKNEYGLSFDTFFNSLNVYLVKKYVGGNHIRLVINIIGEATIFVAYSFKNKLKYLDVIQTSECTYEFDIDELPEKGIIYPIIKGDHREFTIKDFEINKIVE